MCHLMCHRVPVLKDWYVLFDMTSYSCSSRLICVTGRVIVYLYFRVDMCHLICNRILALEG